MFRSCSSLCPLWGILSSVIQERVPGASSSLVTVVPLSVSILLLGLLSEAAHPHPAQAPSPRQAIPKSSSYIPHPPHGAPGLSPCCSIGLGLWGHPQEPWAGAEHGGYSTFLPHVSLASLAGTCSRSSPHSPQRSHAQPSSKDSWSGASGQQSSVARCTVSSFVFRHQGGPLRPGFYWEWPLCHHVSPRLGSYTECAHHPCPAGLRTTLTTAPCPFRDLLLSAPGPGCPIPAPG